MIAQLLVTYMPLETEGQQLLAYGLFWGGTILLSTVLYYGFERPILKWRDRG